MSSQTETLETPVSYITTKPKCLENSFANRHDKYFSKVLFVSYVSNISQSFDYWSLHVDPIIGSEFLTNGETHERQHRY